MRGAAIAAIIIAVFVACIAIGFWITYSATHPQTATRTVCSIIKTEPIKKIIRVNNVTWIEIVEGKRVVKQCKLIELKRVCVYEPVKGYYCTLEPSKVLKRWRATIIEKSRPEIHVNVNLSTYRRLWFKECRSFIKYSKAVSEMYGIELKGIDFVIKHVTRHYLQTPIVYEVPYPIPVPRNAKLFDCDVYVRYVLVPSFRALAKIFGWSNKSLARFVASFISEGGYGKRPQLWEDYMFSSGICQDWTRLALDIARYLGWRAYGVVMDDHEAAFLCEPWWRNSYGIEIVFTKSHASMKCFLWVDTGAAIENWNRIKPTPPIYDTHLREINFGVEVKKLS